MQPPRHEEKIHYFAAFRLRGNKSKHHTSYNATISILNKPLCDEPPYDGSQKFCKNSWGNTLDSKHIGINAEINANKGTIRLLEAAVL